jgi:salicylate hydroxylase
MQSVVMRYGPPSAPDGQWITRGSADELRALFADFNESTRAFLSHATDGDVDLWQIAIGRPLERWHGSTGRVVLVGDAAHAMLPHKAQGLSQGVEDATALARMLRWATPTSGPDGGGRSIPDVVRCYEKFRRPRVERIAEGAATNAWRNVLPDGPEQQARDDAIRARHGGLLVRDWEAVKPDGNASFGSPEFIKWEYDYDVVAQVRDSACLC